ncbi:MAG TPA: DUF4288 domain-containing protein [Bacteroidia bacterium]|nr:DUF4288 domain-containing protein [Bacteroidia bacterium]
MEKVFIAKLIWQIKVNNHKMSSDFDEQLRIIKAKNYSIALQKAQNIGKNMEETLVNTKGQNIIWEFINVEFIKEITSFDDSFEICAQTINVHDAHQYIKEINTKALVNSEVFSN